MWKILGAEIIKPGARRLGSMIAGAAVGIGATQAQVDQLDAALVVVTGIAVDLVLSHLDRNRR